jgi:prevent-host-death family protein
MPTYSIEDAKARLAELIDQALAGEQVWIARDGAPVVELGQGRP